MKPIAKIENSIKGFDAVAWSSSGYPLNGEKPIDVGWVKFGIEKSELGWRTLEFLAWMCTDMIRSGERLRFFPTSAPPYLNTPGECLSFVIECYPLDGDMKTRFAKVAAFIENCRREYWNKSVRGVRR